MTRTLKMKSLKSIKYFFVGGILSILALIIATFWESFNLSGYEFILALSIFIAFIISLIIGIKEIKYNKTGNQLAHVYSQARENAALSYNACNKQVPRIKKKKGNRQ